MAVIKGIRGLEVTILVDDTPLQEYLPLPDDIDDSKKKVTRYVVAEPGKKFGIKVERSPGFKHGAPKWDLATTFEVDGRNIRDMTEDLYECKEQKYATHVQDYVEIVDDNGKWVSHDLLFADVVFDNSAPLPASAKDNEATSSLGEILVEMWRGRVGSPIAPDERKFECVGKLHEKTLKGKAISQQTSLGEAEAVDAPEFCEFEDYDTTPFATFIFKYRSMRDLKAEMIVPRSPSPVPLEDRPRDSLTREELLELLARREAERAVKVEGVKRAKRERPEVATSEATGEDDVNGGDDDELEVIEPPPKRQRVIETVDLTSD